MSTDTAHKPSGGLRRAGRPILRFFVILWVILAVVQASGRFTMATLHLYEDSLNLLLQAVDFRVDGVHGSWYRLNPIVSFDRLSFPAGELRDVEVEISFAESIVRSHLIPRRVRVNGVDIYLERTVDGWRLRGMETGAANDDLWPQVRKMLRHADAVDARATLHLQRAGKAEPEAVLKANVALANQRARHVGRLAVSTNDATNVLRAQFWQQDEVPFESESKLRVTVDGNLVVPSIATGMNAFLLSVVDGEWVEAGGVGGGTGTLALEGVRLVPEQQAFKLRSRLSALRHGERVSARVDKFAVATPGDRLDLGAWHLSLFTGELPNYAAELVEQDSDTNTREPLVRMWKSNLELDRVTEFVQRHLEGWSPVGRWLAALDARGSMGNIHGYLDPELGLGYSATLTDLSMQGYKGAPTLQGVGARLWGHGQGVAAQITGSDTYLHFPDLYHEGWAAQDLQGVLKGWFGSGYFALQGSHLRARIGSTAIAGSFSLSRPNARYEQRVGLILTADQLDLAQARAFTPYTIPDVLSDWLATGPQAASLSAATFAYHGQVHESPGEPSRRIELLADVSNGRIRFDPEWPIARALVGRVHAAGRQTRFALAAGRTQELALYDSHIVVEDNGAFVTADLNGRSDNAQALAYVLTSPLSSMMPFITPQWSGSGPMALSGRLIVPLDEERAPPLAVDMAIELDGVQLAMPEYRVALSELSGDLQFTLPHLVSGELEGQLFDRDTTFELYSDADWVHVAMVGSAEPKDAYELIDYPDVGVLDGEFGYDATLNIAVNDALITNISVSSDLAGLAVDLPGSFAKTPEQSTPSELDVQFLDDYQSVRWNYLETSGWLHYGVDIERGAVGINIGPPMTAQDQQAILVSGRLPFVRLSDWIGSDGSGQIALPLDWQIRNFTVDELAIDELTFTDVKLKGRQTGADVAFEFSSAALTGSVAIPEQDKMSIDLTYLRLPETDTPLDIEEGLGTVEEDPISLEVGESLPNAQVSVAELVIGEDPFGSWRFEMQREADVLYFKPFSADVNGVHITDAALTWDLATNRSTFVGGIELDDLSETLPKWDYAATVETESAGLVVDEASWNGSPANVNLLGVNGRFSFAAEDGRFLDVEGGGGLRIMSLLNFSNIAKRMSFDFSDVTKDGFSFDEVNAVVSLQDQQLNFVEQMSVKSKSSDFKIGGRVDLAAGTLDNEMIVTLPVSDSLPWYGVYLSLANPLAGLGVIVGERVLRKPLSAVSTAKFTVTGTLDEPDVAFVSLWDQTLSKPVEVLPEDAVKSSETQTGSENDVELASPKVES